MPARLFLTIYILNPVIVVVQRGAGLADILGDLAVLLAMMGWLAFVLTLVIRQHKRQPALFG